MAYEYGAKEPEKLKIKMPDLQRRLPRLLGRLPALRRDSPRRPGPGGPAASL